MKPEGDGQPSRHPALTGSAHRSARSLTRERAERKHEINDVGGCRKQLLLN